MVMSENPDFRPKPDTFYWLASLAGFPYGPAVGPFLGSSRPNLGILSTQYIGGLTAWDKIREFAEIHRSSGFRAPEFMEEGFYNGIYGDLQSMAPQRLPDRSRDYHPE